MGVSYGRPAPAEPIPWAAIRAESEALAANRAAAQWLVHDLNLDPSLPFPDASFDAVTCCVSVDYLIRPLEVFPRVVTAFFDQHLATAP